MAKITKLVPMLLAVPLIIMSDAAFARGGGPSFMDSYGYQRRLQESQGLVTMQSSPAPKPLTVAPKTKKPKHHH
jgi:hypothetical protein